MVICKAWTPNPDNLGVKSWLNISLWESYMTSQNLNFSTYKYRNNNNNLGLLWGLNTYHVMVCYQANYYKNGPDACHYIRV